MLIFSRDVVEHVHTSCTDMISVSLDFDGWRDVGEIEE